MAKKFSAPLERTARLLDLVPYITSHQGISLKDLAAVFKVDQAQMTSDLTTLWMCGLPGYTPLELMDLNFESGFVTIHNAETLSKPRSITFDEGVALVLGLDLLRSVISPERRDLLERIDLLSQRLAGLIKLPSALSATSVVNQEVSAAISDALKSRMGLEISYHSLYRDEISTRIIFPIEIVESEGHLYLSSYCYTASDFREFRIDRIQGAAVQEVLQEIPKSSVQQSRYTCTIKVLIPTRAVAERFKQSELQVNTAFDFETYSFQWIERSIMASGRAVCLQSPPDVRKSIAAMAQTMLDRYKAR
ncbi:MAG: WYL domain-containing protein [Actinobacteria bacterium]|nr:WYL domain-containing protein [Actinomycetota bacterium]